MGDELENPTPNELTVEVEEDATIVVTGSDSEEETEPLVIVETEEVEDKWETVQLNELSLTALEANRLSNQAVLESNRALAELLQSQIVAPPVETVVVVEEQVSPSETPSLEETETVEENPPAEEKPAKKQRARSPSSLLKKLTRR